jgi:hypothetical protein
MQKDSNMSESTAFTINLIRAGDEDATFRVAVQNGPDEVERKVLTDHGSEIKVLGDMVDVVHGRLTPGGARATLIIALFRFQSASQRFQKAEISLKFFSGSKPGSDLDPEVMKIAYENVYFWNPTVVDGTVKYNANLSAQAGGGPGQLGAGVGWEQTENYKITDRALLFGSIRFEGRDHGAKNAVEWTLKENKEAKDGIPGFFATAILLKRKTNDRFSMTVEVDVEAGIMSQAKGLLQKLFGRKDAPVIFDPTRQLPRTDFDQNNLLNVDLKKHSKVRGAEQIFITPKSKVQPESEVFSLPPQELSLTD